MVCSDSTKVSYTSSTVDGFQKISRQFDLLTRLTFDITEKVIAWNRCQTHRTVNVQSLKENCSRVISSFIMIKLLELCIDLENKRKLYSQSTMELWEWEKVNEADNLKEWQVSNERSRGKMWILQCLNYLTLR